MRNTNLLFRIWRIPWQIRTRETIGQAESNVALSCVVRWVGRYVPFLLCGIATVWWLNWAAKPACHLCSGSPRYERDGLPSFLSAQQNTPRSSCKKNLGILKALNGQKVNNTHQKANAKKKATKQHQRKNEPHHKFPCNSNHEGIFAARWSVLVQRARHQDGQVVCADWSDSHGLQH